MYEYYHETSGEFSQSMEQSADASTEQTRQPFGQPFGQPSGQFGPPFGQPFGQQFGPFGFPIRPPFGQAQQFGQSGPPKGRPPAFTPKKVQTGAPGIFAVDPGAIRPCVRRFVYIWLNTGEQFWAWLVFVGPRSAAGWRWTGFRWIYFGVDLRNIDSFECY